MLLDSGGSAYPGDNYFDQGVIPGTMHYYGIYILVQVGAVQVWYQAGLTACLAITNYDSMDIMLLNRLPEYWKIGTLTNPLELTTDQVGNSYLTQFMGIFGWGLDYLKTQLSLTENVNNVATVPVNWLVNLAATVGFPYYPQVQAVTMRDAIANQAFLVKNRGTLLGIESRVTQLTGWAADIQPGVNLMLEDDQSDFTDPIYPLWNADVSYNLGETVSWGPAGAGDYFFSSAISANLGNTPPLTFASNSFWTFIYYASNPYLLANPTTGWLNTWEPLIDNLSIYGYPAPGTLTERVGIMTPPSLGVYTQNGLGITNTTNTPSTIELRSVSRSVANINAGLQYPTRDQVIGDGIPVPYTLPRQQWYSWIEYATGAVVSYQGMPYLALKGSTGVTPPANGIPGNEWQPIGYDQRIALMLSGYTGQNLNVAGDLQYPVTPYVLWFDETGAFISSVYLRAPSPLSNNYPSSIYFESFAQPSGWGSTITGTAPDIGVPGTTWTAQVSNFVANAFNNGAAVPAVANTQTIETISYGSPNAFVGVTLSTLANSGWYSGLAVRWVSSTSYIRVDQAGVTANNAGTYITLAMHSTAFSAGDRMTVSCNGNTIIVYRNGVPVSTVITSFNNTATVFGIIVETSLSGGAALTDSASASDVLAVLSSQPLAVLQDPYPGIQPPAGQPSHTIGGAVI